MRREIGPLRILANLGFIAGVIALAAFGASRVASRHWQVQETFLVRAEFAKIAGLEVGARVFIQGMDAGVVESIVAPSGPGRPVGLVLRIDATLRNLVRSDATATIVSQGVVGSRVVELIPGRPEAPALVDGASIRSERPIEMADLLQDARASLKRVDAVAQKAEQGLVEVNALAASIRQGRGTLGRLIQDDDAYRRLLAVSDRGEKAFGELEENLVALKSTWPLKNYFERRAYYDLDRVLYKPGADREGRILAETDLFEPGRAILTLEGRRKLDAFALWFRAFRRPRAAEVVIAAFTDGAPQGEDLARVLTQDQADAVRQYLVDRYAIDSAGWFRSRKVAAVGFGTETPRTSAVAAGQPPRRVEILVFTPPA